MNIARIKRKTWPRKNLGEVCNFLDKVYPGGYSLQDLARDFDTSPQAVSNWFRRDDMTLAHAEEIGRIYGYGLTLYFPTRNFNDGYIPGEPTRKFNNAGNLTGLIKYIQDSEWSIAFVAEQTGVANQTLTRAFEKGNIRLSTLNKIVDGLGLVIQWEYKKTKQ